MLSGDSGLVFCSLPKSLSSSLNMAGSPFKVMRKIQEKYAIIIYHIFVCGK